MSGEEQSDLAGSCLVKRRKENSCYLSKISVFLSFLPCLGELKYHWLKSRKGQKTVKIMFDEERLNPHGVGNLPHNKNTSHPHLESERVECTYVYY